MTQVVSLRGALGECAEGLGCELELHAADALGLNIDRKGATGMTLGVADFVPLSASISLFSSILSLSMKWPMA